MYMRKPFNKPYSLSSCPFHSRKIPLVIPQETKVHIQHKNYHPATSKFVLPFPIPHPAEMEMEMKGKGEGERKERRRESKRMHSIQDNQPRTNHRAMWHPSQKPEVVIQTSPSSLGALAPYIVAVDVGNIGAPCTAADAAATCTFVAAGG